MAGSSADIVGNSGLPPMASGEPESVFTISGDSSREPLPVVGIWSSRSRPKSSNDLRNNSSCNWKSPSLIFCTISSKTALKLCCGFFLLVRLGIEWWWAPFWFVFHFFLVFFLHTQARAMRPTNAHKWMGGWNGEWKNGRSGRRILILLGEGRPEIVVAKAPFWNWWEIPLCSFPPFFANKKFNLNFMI